VWVASGGDAMINLPIERDTRRGGLSVVELAQQLNLKSTLGHSIASY